MITTCDRSANIHVACSTFSVTLGSCFAVSKGFVHSSSVCSSVLVFFRLFLVAQIIRSVLYLKVYIDHNFWRNER